MTIVTFTPARITGYDLWRGVCPKHGPILIGGRFIDPQKPQLLCVRCEKEEETRLCKSTW